MNGDNKKSVYILGAEDGALLGLIMSATIVLFGAATYAAWLAFPALLFAIAVPVYVYFCLGRTFKNDSKSSLSALWLQGICMFFFGALEMAVVIYVFLKWITPEFIMQQLDTVINLYNSIDDPQAVAIADTFEKIKEAGVIPSPLDVALEMIYFAVFSGSILSLIYAALIRRKKSSAKTPPPFSPQ